MFFHNPLNAVQFMFREASVLGKGNRFEPELGDLPVALHMNMRWFISVRAKENERIGSVSKNGWHGNTTS